MNLKRKRVFLDDLAQAYKDRKSLGLSRYYKAIGDIRGNNDFKRYWIARITMGTGERTRADSFSNRV